MNLACHFVMAVHLASIRPNKLRDNDGRPPCFKSRWRGGPHPPTGGATRINGNCSPANPTNLGNTVDPFTILVLNMARPGVVCVHEEVVFVLHRTNPICVGYKTKNRTDDCRPVSPSDDGLRIGAGLTCHDQRWSRVTYRHALPCNYTIQPFCIWDSRLRKHAVPVEIGGWRTRRSDATSLGGRRRRGGGKGGAGVGGKAVI